MRVLLRWVLLGLVIATVRPPRALGDPAAPAPEPAAVKLAKQYVEAGLAAQDAHDYDTAIALYARAYELVPHPLLIFNLAQAHRLAGHPDKAVVLYRRYLAEDPEGAQASNARELVAELERPAEKQRAATATSQAPAAAEPARRDAGKDDAPGEPAAVRPAAAEREASRGGIVVVARSQTGEPIPRGTVLVDDERRGELVDGRLVIRKLTDGRHTVAIEAGGYQRFEQRATVRDGERTRLDAQLVDAPPPASGKAWKWALAGSAGVTVGSGVFTWYAFRRQNDAIEHLPSGISDDSCGRSAASLGLSPAEGQALDKACAWNTRAQVGSWLTVAGLGATVVSLVAVLGGPGPSDSSAARQDKHQIAIAPIVAPGSAGAALSGRW